jgi:hypothetical protein
MAQGVRVQVVLPQSIADKLKDRANAESRTVSSLVAYMIESALRATSC